MAKPTFHKYRFKTSAISFTNYAVLTATAILVLITAHVKSSILSDNNLPITTATLTTTPRPVIKLEELEVLAQQNGDRFIRLEEKSKDSTQDISSSDFESKEHEHNQQHHYQHSRHTDLYSNKYQHHQHHNTPAKETVHNKHRSHHHNHNSLTPKQLFDKKRPYHSKYTIEELLHMKFEKKVSNDIDMDPCKAGGFMGDIALPDVDQDPVVARTEDWELQADEASVSHPQPQFNISFQQELEILKQEVYHEGLQVEEEGLTDIFRKKTKLPSSVNEQSNERSHNDAVVSANELVKPMGYSMDAEHLGKNYKNEVLSPQERWKERPYTTAETGYFEPKPVLAVKFPEIQIQESRLRKDSHEVDIEDGGSGAEKLHKPITGLANRNVDQRKIQSNTKDIEDDSGNNFVAERKFVILPTALPTQRSTLPNVYSNANVMKLDDVEYLHAEGVVQRRYRRRHKKRRSSDTPREFSAKVERLKAELDRPVRTVQDYHRQRRLEEPAANIEKKGNVRKINASQMLNYSSEAIDELEFLTKRKSTMDAITAEVNSSLELELKNPEGLEHVKHHHRMARAVTAKKERIWDYGVIPYEIDGNFSGLHKALFKQAMRHWENSTCIKFVERDPEIHPNYIVFTVRSCGCCSFVGKRGNGPQAISIGRNCDKFGIVVHELGHVVGFWHEHTRPDREKHVVIEHNNIMKGQDYNFNKLTPDEVDSLGMAYDYDSIMHYARNTFSKGTYLDTILPIEVKGKKRPEIGQRLRLSAGDIAQANLLYKCPKCGRTFQENTGIFATPAYYTAGALTNETEHCEWRITATHGERVVLRIENLNILKSNNCQTDYLEVRDGYYPKSPLIGRFCGKVNKEDLTTESSRMLLIYVNTHRAEGFRGFKAEYDVICGGELSVDDAEGRLESPNYPLDYLPNKECVWKISVPKGYQVALKFQSFGVENHDSCVYDFVEVRDGPDADAPLIGVFCGYKPPPNMKSSGHSMYVKFVSDTSIQKAGFSAIFMKEVDECETQNHGCEHDCINTLGGYECSCHIGYELHSDKKHCEDACGGVIEYPNGTITSPSFPAFYPVLKNCIWEIIAPPKHKISLNFTHFDLEGTTHVHSDCSYDSVTIYSKLSENRLKRIGTYCGGSIPPTATSEGNALRVEFHSDKSTQRTGFAAMFFTDIDECSINNGGCQHECRNTIGSYMCSCHNGYSLHENGHDCKEGECKHEISASFGNIYSPNFPDSYPPNADCVWHFSTTPGHRIKLIFNDFNVESHQECTYDNVAIYDGESESSSILGRFCGDKIPYPISSSTNQLYMVLKTDKNKQLNGFAAIHSTSCGGYLRATRQIQQFYSHARFGNHDYNENMDCEWTIQAPANSNVQLLFLTFDIETSENCTYDYVQVYSGMEDTSGPMYGQYCGNSLPQDIISLTDSLLVRFKTDSSVNMKGFSASYVIVDPFENSDEDDMNSYSAEMITPFPGSLKSIYKEDTQESEDYSDFSENHLVIHSPYRSRNRYQTRF